ncbi:hypothetical protein BDD14_5479 [Edaphobacter modestus]|uniref:Uncharacterized protein n=1 Tax=Edaphobacter modestus TaxID=388466 RepID=A0A4Q7YDM9_9BACT|nr:hypothetical protein BDD14_5479 [Edaphobacter modestus]
MSKAIAWLTGWKLLAALDRLPAQTVTALQSLDLTIRSSNAWANRCQEWVDCTRTSESRGAPFGQFFRP